MEMVIYDRKSSDYSFIKIIFFLICLNFFVILRDFFSTFWSIILIFAKLVDGFAITAGSDHGDGEAEEKRVSIGEVREIMESLESLGGGDGGGETVELFEEEASVEEMKEAFDVFDENGDGFIDSEELQKALAAMGFPQFTEVEIERMIGAFDCNGDGRIDFQEFLQLSDQSF